MFWTFCFVNGNMCSFSFPPFHFGGRVELWPISHLTASSARQLINKSYLICFLPLFGTTLQTYINDRSFGSFSARWLWWNITSNSGNLLDLGTPLTNKEFKKHQNIFLFGHLFKSFERAIFWGIPDVAAGGAFNPRLRPTASNHDGFQALVPAVTGRTDVAEPEEGHEREGMGACGFGVKKGESKIENATDALLFRERRGFLPPGNRRESNRPVLGGRQLPNYGQTGECPWVNPTSPTNLLGDDLPVNTHQISSSWIKLYSFPKIL